MTHKGRAGSEAKSSQEPSNKRFLVQGNVCFVRLLANGPVSAGLILQGEHQMEEFCQEAIKAFEKLIRNKKSASEAVKAALSKIEED